MNQASRYLLIIATSVVVAALSARIGHADDEDAHFAKLKGFLARSREELKRAPHWVDLYRFANANGINLFKSIKPEQTGKIVDEMKAAHRDLPITKEDLFSILKSQRQAIRTWKGTAQIHRTFGDASKVPKLPSAERRRFTSAEGRFLMEGESLTNSGEGGDYYLWSCSDGIQRNVGRTPKSEPGGKLRQPASIEKMQQDPTLTFYSQPGNIIGDTMMVDSGSLGLPRTFGAVDIMHIEPMSFVLEGRHDVNGSQCVCLMTPIATYYLDIEHGFALCRCERLPKMHVTNVEYTIEAGSFIDHGSGIWLPSQLSKTWYNSAKTDTIDLKETITYADVSVNEPVPNEEFTDIIPAGAFVTDHTKNITYVANEKGEIATFISEAVPTGLKPAPARRNLFWLILGNVVVATTFFAWLVFRKIKSRRQ